MILDYGLAISCALGALAILYIIDLRRRLLRLRERRRSAENPFDASRAPPVTKQAVGRSAKDLSDETAWRFYDRLIFLLLILALLWFAGRIWVQA